MSGLSSISAVMARIGAIEARFGIAGQPVVETTSGPSTASSATFAESLSAVEAGGGISAGPMSAPVLPATGATSSGNGVVRISSSVPPAAAPAPAPSAAVDGTGSVPPSGERVNPSIPYAAEFEAAGERYGISPRLLAAVAKVESSYRPDAVSAAGAIGIMQLMPATAAGLGVDPRDPVASIHGAARLLRDLQGRFGTIELALGAYNVGPGTISRAGGIEPGSQAEKYVNAVISAMETT